MNNTSMDDKKGKLTIFLSYTPGAGKSYIMLSRASEEKERGRNVVVAFLNDTHRDNGDGIHKKPTKYSLSELVDEKPDLVVIDEMGMGGINRDERTHVYDDIEELLGEGIDVYTTANLKRFENVNPLFKELSGIGIKKTIPGRFLDLADHIVFVDREPDDMIEDFENGMLFIEKYMDSKIMRKNFRKKTLEEYRKLSMEILKKYENKVEIVINNFER